MRAAVCTSMCIYSVRASLLSAAWTLLKARMKEGERLHQTHMHARTRSACMHKDAALARSARTRTDAALARGQTQCMHARNTYACTRCTHAHARKCTHRTHTLSRKCLANMIKWIDEWTDEPTDRATYRVRTSLVPSEQAAHQRKCVSTCSHLFCINKLIK